MATLRFKMVEDAIKRKALAVPTPEKRPSEYYGMYVFTEDKMRKYLPQKTYEALLDTMKHGKALARDLAGRCIGRLEVESIVCRAAGGYI